MEFHLDKGQFLSDVMKELEDNLEVGINELESDPGTGKTLGTKRYFKEQVAFLAPMISIAETIEGLKAEDKSEIKSEVYRLEKFAELTDEALEGIARNNKLLAFDELQLMTEHDFRASKMAEALIRIHKLSKMIPVMSMTGTPWPFSIFEKSNKIIVKKEQKKRDLEIVKVESSSDRSIKSYSKTFADLIKDAHKQDKCLVLAIIDSSKALHRIQKNLTASGLTSEMVTAKLYKAGKCPVATKLISDASYESEVDVILGTSYLEIAISIEEKVTIISDQCSSRAMKQRFARGRKESRLIAVVGTGTWNLTYPTEDFNIGVFYNKRKYAKLIEKFKSLALELYPVEFHSMLQRFMRIVNAAIFVRYMSSQTAFAGMVVRELSETYNITSESEAIKGKKLHQKRVSRKAYIEHVVRGNMDLDTFGKQFDYDEDDVQAMNTKYQNFDMNINKLSDMIQGEPQWIFTKISAPAFDWIAAISNEEAQAFKEKFFVARKAFAPEILKAREMESNIANQQKAFARAMVGITGPSLDKLKSNRKIALEALNNIKKEHDEKIRSMSFVFWNLELNEYLVNEKDVHGMYSLMEILLGGYPDRYNMIKIDDTIKKYVHKDAWETGVKHADASTQRKLRQTYGRRIEKVDIKKFCLRFDITEQAVAELSTKEFNQMVKQYEI